MSSVVRIVAVLLELVIPGAGSYSRGNRRRGSLIFGGSALALGAIAAFAAVGSSTGMWAGVAVGCAVRLFGLISSRRSLRLTPPSTRELVLVLVVAAAGLLVVRSLLVANVVEAFAVPSGSMYPTIATGDRVMVSKLSRPFQRGDIIAFRAPNAPENVHLKRIIGLQGDRIEIQGDEVILNGSPLEHQRIDALCRGAGACEVLEERAGQRRYHVAISKEAESLPSPTSFTVPPGNVFVLGDNRHWSLDSRSFGPVPLQNFVGQSAFTWWRSDS